MTTKVPQELLSGGPELLGVHGSDVASAATINLNNTTGDCVDVTGTATITANTAPDGAGVWFDRGVLDGEYCGSSIRDNIGADCNLD